MPESKVITILSDGPHLPTGYSNQAKQLVQHWEKKGHKIHWLANAYNGATLDGIKLDDGTEMKAKIYGEMIPSYFCKTMEKHLKDTKTDIFIVLLDTFMLFQPNKYGAAGWFLSKDLSPSKSFFWYPTDGGGGMPKQCEKILNKVDVPVAMAKFGAKQVKDYHNIDSKYIPLGCDISRFKRLPDDERDNLRKMNGLDDKFVIGVVARNQPRKHLDRTIKVMYKLKDKIPNAVMYLHMDPEDAAGMYDLRSLIQRYGLENRVFFSGMMAHKGFGWDKMNEVYNLMDVFLLTTSGEGFGIPIIEAMACEVPVLATDYTTTQELVIDNNCGFGIKLSGVEHVDMFKTNMKEYDDLNLNGTMTGSWEVERGFCEIDDAVNKLEMLKNFPSMRKDMGKNGRLAVERDYDFKKIAKQWDKLIE